MKINSIEKAFICQTVTEISNRYEMIMELIPRDDPVLKHLAATSIHMALFMKDFYSFITGEKDPLKEDKVIEEFLKQCGCNFNKNVN